VMVIDARLVLSTNRSKAFSASESGADSKSSSTALTRSSVRNSAATAACDLIQNKHWFRADVNAAISSRKPGLSGEGPRITSCVKRPRWLVRSGLYANRCRICSMGVPERRMLSLSSAYGPGGWALCSRSRKNIGSCIG
jgi:hypothetical protein